PPDEPESQSDQDSPRVGPVVAIDPVPHQREASHRADELEADPPDAPARSTAARLWHRVTLEEDSPGTHQNRTLTAVERQSSKVPGACSTCEQAAHEAWFPPLKRMPGGGGGRGKRGRAGRRRRGDPHPREWGSPADRARTAALAGPVSRPSSSRSPG